MAKRKQQNLVMERQLKKRKTIFRVISIAVAAAIVLAIGFGIWSVQDSRWVLRYDGGRVATNDFRAIMDIEFAEWRDNPMAREAAIGSLEYIVAIHDRAAHHGMVVSAEDRAIAESWVDNQIRVPRTFWGPQGPIDPLAYISNERLVELFVIAPLSSQLMDLYVPEGSIEIDEEELAQQQEEYVEEELDNYLDLQVMVLELSDPIEMENAYSLIGTIPFEDIVRMSTPWMVDEDDVVHSISAMDLAHLFDDQPEDLEYLLGLAEGENTSIIELAEFGFYVVFYAVSREEPDPDTVKEIFRDRYVLGRRNEVFENLVSEWVQESNFRVNRRGYNAV